jgi:NADPH-dependent 7-cyano-7-deazaguanine reductase QueF
MIETVGCSVDVSCRLTQEITTICPIRPETDRYKITVSWNTEGNATFEKHSLFAFLDSFDGTELTQERLTANLHSELADTDVADVTVTVEDIEHMDMVAEK